MTPLWYQTAFAPNGELWLLGCRYLVRVAKGEARATALPAPGLRRGRFVGGRLVGEACNFAHTVASVELDGTYASTDARTSINFGLDALVDARGRVWGDSSGIVVANPDGSTASYPAGAIPEINGDVTAMLVVGAGPDELPRVAEVAIGTLSGLVLDHGTPVASAAVEICRVPSRKFRTTPCEYASDRITGTTDAAGGFRIEGPLKAYRVVAEIKGSWYTLADKECTGLAPGADCLYGVLDLANRIER